jgi:hypothetical protein
VTTTSRPNQGLSWADARRSPCATCQPSYCCTHVLLHRFNVRSLVHVDLLQYLLNFEGIVLGIDEEFSASVFLNQPCFRLDVEAGICTVHGTDEQPAECRHYPAFGCEARRTMSTGNDPGIPLMDQARFEWLRDRLFFDDERQLDSGPLWSEILAGFEAIPLSRHPAPPPPPDPALSEWREVVIGRRQPAPVSPIRWGDPTLTDPCSSCRAYCCETLIFPYSPPATVGDMDHLRLLLGFPSIELGISEDRWQLFVHVRCQHLSDTKCTIFGQPERPLKCESLPSVGCDIKLEFAEVDPSRAVRVDRDLYPALESAIPFDRDGKVIAIPPVPLLRTALGQMVVVGP